ncbi:MAG TPA: FHA domain-containing protein [Candidatus Thermoplasmatota archaeon]|nr:FHA domain-containing protein [Candidatus Thermoplasmatota archaeon]
MPEPRPTRVDYVDLAETLQALSYPARLELLDILRFPHTAAEVKLTPHRVVAGENPERAVSKQAVQAHLDKLVDAGLVRVTTTERGGRQVNEFLVNSQRFYAIVEDLRRLCVRYAGRGPVGDQTGTLGSPAPTGAPRGPRLTLVHGVYEAKVFPLVAETAREGRWTIGRQRGVAVSLDYDPYVSSEHAHLTLGPKGYTLTDAADSKNGTFVNWEPLPKGGSVLLRSADILGVGRSLLCFAAE